MATPKVDLISQYISQVLIPRLNRADALYSQRRYIDAVDTQIRIIKTLYRETEEEKEKLREWTELFGEIIKKANSEHGRTNALTAWKKMGKMDILARELYDELDWEIWSYLHELGYFKPSKSYGLSMDKLDAIEAQEQ